MGRLYLIEDVPARGEEMTFRMLRVLKEVTAILAWDAGALREQLGPCQVSTPLRELTGLQAVLEALQKGDVAWIVGGLSHRASSLLRALLDRGVEVVPVPGALPETAALVASGLPLDQFTFLGLLPPSARERHGMLQAVAGETRTLACDVPAGCLPAALDDVQAVLGDRRMALYQQGVIWRGRASQAPGSAAGQATLVIEGAGSAASWTEARVRAQVHALLAAGTSPRDAAHQVAAICGWPRRQVYAIAMDEGQTTCV